MTGKIFRSTFIVGVSLVLLCCLLFFGVLFNYYENQVYSELSAEASYISQGIELSGEEYLNCLEGGNRVTWVNTDGVVIYDSIADAASMENHLNREEIADAMEKGHGQSSHFSETLLEKNLYYAVRMEDGTIVRVSCKQSSIVAMLLMMLREILLILAVVLLLCAFLAFHLAKQITRPINSIDLDDPHIDNTYKELEPLVSRLKEQNRTIKLQIDELSLKQREFSAITDNMSEGFLLVDSKTNVLSSNHSALQILQTNSDISIKNLREVDCNRDICAVVEKALACVRAEKIITLEGRSWQIIANPVISKGHVSGVVVIVMDVTEREQRELLRKEFSANVSHELKTPLTSISGFAELMKEGLVPMEKIKEFSGDIYHECRRLIDLVDDIIKLSKLDENSQLFTEEPTDLYDLAGEILANLQPIANTRNISLKLTGEHITINGVWQILNEMIYNLCDNAIKYNKDGGSVTVFVGGKGSEAILSVTDTGIGIPYADQSRVFERFYRVDKSHSKEIGGTGLGLSIVKHGAQYHNARIELDSEPGKGTTITVIF